MRHSYARLFLISCCVFCGCGGSEDENLCSEQPLPQRHTGSETRADEEDFQVEGLMGSLSASEVRQALEPRNPAFLRCFFARWRELRMLGGRIEMAFRVGTDGAVLWVYPRASTLGDRATERCILDVAAQTRFPAPHGGEAEFASPLEIDPPEGVRPPVPWTIPDETITEIGAALGDCGIEDPQARFQVTAYVGRDGEVLSAGGAVSNRELVGHLDCVTDTMRLLTMPTPDEFPAKVSFEVGVADGV